MKITRRELGLAIGTAATIAAEAQNPAPGNQPPDFDKAARERNASNSETLAKFEIPISTEPAFQFRA